MRGYKHIDEYTEIRKSTNTDPQQTSPNYLDVNSWQLVIGKNVTYHCQQRQGRDCYLSHNTAQCWRWNTLLLSQLLRVSFALHQRKK